MLLITTIKVLAVLLHASKADAHFFKKFTLPAVELPRIVFKEISNVRSVIECGAFCSATVQCDGFNLQKDLESCLLVDLGATSNNIISTPPQIDVGLHVAIIKLEERRELEYDRHNSSALHGWQSKVASDSQASTDLDCLFKCDFEPDCSLYVFNPFSKMCYFGGNERLATPLQTNLNGSVVRIYQKKRRLLVDLGYGGDAVLPVEADGPFCSGNPLHAATEFNGICAEVLQDKHVFFCGGNGFNACRLRGTSNIMATMRHKRDGCASIALNSTHMLVTGGASPPDDNPGLGNSEIVGVYQKWIFSLLMSLWLFS